MRKIISILILSIFMYSCGEHEDVIFDNTKGQTLAYFTKNNADLQIPIGNGNSATLDIAFGVSTLSKNDRTITFSIDENNSDAPISMFSINTFTVTIPANEYNGNAQITGNYDSILDNENKTVTLNIESITGDDGIVDITKQMKITISMFCPIPDDYIVGMYLIEQTSSFVDGPTLSDGTTIEITAEGTKRFFSTKNYPDYCGGVMDFSFNLVCNEIIVDTLNSVCSCGDGADWFGPATIPTNYDLASDAVIYITFTDDANSNCGTPAQTTYKLTKQ